MNHHRSPEIFMVMTAAVIAATGVGVSSRIAVPASSRWQEPELAVQARRIITQLKEGKFAEATSRWNDEMLQALPAPKMEEFWTTLLGQVGTLSAIGPAAVAPQAEYRVVTLPLTFEQAELVGTVVFDAQGKVAGINVRPTS